MREYPTDSVSDYDTGERGVLLYEKKIKDAKKAKLKDERRATREAYKRSKLSELISYLEPLLDEAKILSRKVSTNNANINRTMRKIVTEIEKEYKL